MDTLKTDMYGRTATISIQSPPANALSSAMLEDLSKELDSIAEDGQAKVVVLKGEGKFFSAGADVKEFTELQQTSDYESLSRNGQQLFDRMENFHIPIIASIHGAALGGGLELAMACHIRVATEDAKLGLPEMTLGIIPGFAGTQRLPHYVGTQKAYEMILTGEPISGKEAYDHGLVSKVVTESELDTTVDGLAAKISEKSMPGINRVMQLVPYTKPSRFQQGVEQEAKMFGEIFGNEDASEGIHAFLEKRSPHFQDK